MLAAYRDRLWIIRQAVALRPFLCAATLAAVLVSAALPLGSIAATAALIGAIPVAVADGFESPATCSSPTTSWVRSTRRC